MNKRLALVVSLIFLMAIVSIPLIKAQSTANIVINPDGSVAGTYSIQQVGNTYTLTANISENIQVEKSNIVIDGAGYALDGGIDLSNNIQHEYNNPAITNVTVENMYLKNAGINTNGGGNNIFYDDYFVNCSRDEGGFAIFLLGCSYNNISYCTFDDESIVSMDYGGNYNIVTECNLPADGGVLVWLIGYETVDRNYWSDYSTKYPNATEVGQSGVGNQPYVYYSLPDGTNGTIVYQDNYPLMKPVTIPLEDSNPSSTSASPVPELSWLVILPLLLSVFCVAGMVRHPKNR